jgi:ligand-binding sensor domain-containing protein
MRSTITYRFILFCSFAQLFACKEQNAENHPAGSFSPTIAEVRNYTISLDSIGTTTILINKKNLKKVRAGKPLVVHLDNNIYPGSMRQIVVANKLKVNTPGTDTFLSPKTIPVAEKPVVGRMPEKFAVREMTYKAPDPASIASFGKLHGLKGIIVTRLMQDNTGNLWICTSGGVTKYDGYSFSNFTTEQGLVYNDIRSILQDKNGNIWFGSLGGGVSKYDGHSFTSFTAKDGLPNNYVLSITEDKQGNIWFGTWHGLIEYDGHSFTNYTHSEGLANDSVETVITDRAGNVWAGTHRGLSKYNGHSFANYAEKEGLSNSNVSFLHEDKSGDIWIGTLGGGVYIFNGLSFSHLNSKKGLPSDDIFCFLQDRDGYMWIGTHDGLSKYDGNSFTSFTEKQGLTNENIYCLLEDKAGNIWIGTGGGGVLKYNPHSFTHITETEGLNKSYVFSVYEDRTGKLWFGTWRGGVSEYDGNSLKIFTEKTGLPANDVRSVCEDKTGNFWFATYKGIAKFNGDSFTYFTEKDGLVNNDVNAITEDVSGNLWISTANGVSKYDGHTFTNFLYHSGASNTVNYIKQDSKGNLWLATSVGIFEYNQYGFTKLNNINGFLTVDTYCVCEDKSGNLWFGTEKGVFKYNGRSAIELTKKEGLIANEVVCLHEDSSGNLWFGTRFGLSKLSPEKSVLLNKRTRQNRIYNDDVFFNNYGYLDNFLGIGCANNAILESIDHHIWIGTNNGITTFDPLAESTDRGPLHIQLTAVKIANESIDWTRLDKKRDTSFQLNNGVKFSKFKFDTLSRWFNLPHGLSLAYNDNYLSFDFVVPTTDQPQNVKYQYQLEGFDKTVNSLTTQPTVSYGNLPPGKYTFWVKGMNANGFWSDEYRYGFVIRPPWWQTVWFKAVAGTAVALLVFFVSRFVYTYELRKQRVALEKELAVQYERQRISADLHDEIGSTLSSLNIYSKLAKTEKDKEPYLESIVNNVNEAVSKLDDLVWRISPQYDILSSVIYRLMSYAEPLANAKEISITVQATEDIKSLKLQAETKHHLLMILKELVNNSVKHSGCSMVTIVFSKQHNYLQLVVRDNGKGFDQANTPSQRNGLYNISQRVKIMHGTIYINSGMNRGTETIIRVPFI